MYRSTNAPLAQLAEQLTLNQWVPGSSPGGCTKTQFLLTRAGFSSIFASSTLLAQKPEFLAAKEYACAFARGDKVFGITKIISSTG